MPTRKLATLAFVLSFNFVFVHGLNAKLKEITARWNPEDPYNDDWQNELYELT